MNTKNLEKSQSSTNSSHGCLPNLNGSNSNMSFKNLNPSTTSKQQISVKKSSNKKCSEAFNSSNSLEESEFVPVSDKNGHETIQIDEWNKKFGDIMLITKKEIKFYPGYYKMVSGLLTLVFLLVMLFIDQDLIASQI